jgi:hypothetical protein
MGLPAPNVKHAAGASPTLAPFLIGLLQNPPPVPKRRFA